MTGNDVILTATLKTPVGNIELGRCVLNDNEPTCTVGAQIADFKAELTVRVDYARSTLTLEATACAPIVGCATGSVTIQF